MSGPSLLSLAVTLSFVAVALASLFRLRITRDRPSLLLAGVLSALAFASVAGRINELTDYRLRIIGDLALVAFVASGYLMLLLRDAFVPLSKITLRATGLALAGLVSAALVVGLPSGREGRYDPVEFGLVLALIAAWTLTAGEPMVRFWVASRRLPAVQKARMRSLASGVAGIILVLLVSVAAGPSLSGGAEVAFDILGLALVPILYVSFAPPDWLRKAWEHDQRPVSVAQDLADYAPDSITLARRVLKNALEIVGADRGFVRGVDGGLLATDGIEPEDAQRIDEALGQAPGADVIPLERGEGYALVRPLQEQGSAALIVLSGRYTPLFGSYEVERLREFGAVAWVAMDRVRLVEALAEETDRYQALLQAVSDLGEGFVITEGSRLVYANDAYMEMTGYTFAELRAMPSLMDLTIPEQRAEITERYRRRLQGEEEATHYEAGFLRKDGTVVFVEVSLKLLELEPVPRMITIVRDITARRRAEEALERQRGAVELLQQIAVAANEAGELKEALQVAVDGICRYSGWPVGHAFLPATPAGKELVSAGVWYVEDPALYKAFMDTTTSAKIRAGEGLAGRVFEGGRPIWMADVSTDPSFMRMAPGIRAGFAFPVLIESEAVGVLEFFSDSIVEPDEHLLDVVTHIGAQLGRTAERERINLLRDEFIANAAHELRTPVTSIVGFSSLLSEQGRLSDEELRASVRSIARQGERLRNLVNNLLDFTRVQQGRLRVDLQRLDLRQALESSVEAVPPPDGKQVDLRANGSVEVMADPVRLEQIVTNILTNSYRYGGDSIWIDFEPDEDSVDIRICDDGPGVPRALRAGLFDPFTRGESSNTDGSGLGLAIVRMLAQLQGGDIRYEEPAEGAAFVVTIPRP